MNMQLTPTAPAKPQTDWSAIIQLGLSALASTTLLAIAVIIALINILGARGSNAGTTSLTQPFMVAGSLAFGGIMLLPSAWYSWKHIRRQDSVTIAHHERKNFWLIFTLFSIIVVSITLALGNFVASRGNIAWLFLPSLNIIAAGLPTLWLIYAGTRGLGNSSPKRIWGIFGVGLALGPLIILILELILLIGVGIMVLMWITLNPSLFSQFTSLAFRLQYAAPNTDQVLKIILPYLQQPGVIFIGFAVISVLIPLIEETIKPVALWFLVGQKITPVQGFTYGIISGAAFGLFENLGNASNAVMGWASVVASRMSTLLLHSFTAGLVGWALASAWSQKKYLRLGVAFAIAVMIHGLWNGLAVLSSIGSIGSSTNVSVPNNLRLLGTISTIGIILMGVLVFIAFFAFNRYLRRSMPPAASALPGSEPPAAMVDDSATSSIKEPPDQPDLHADSPQAGLSNDAPDTADPDQQHLDSNIQSNSNSGTNE